MRTAVLTDRPVIGEAVAQALTGAVPGVDVQLVSRSTGRVESLARPVAVAVIDLPSLAERLRTCRQLGNRAVSVVAVVDGPDDAVRLLEAGAIGVVTPGDGLEAVVEAVVTAAENQTFVPATLMWDVMQSVFDYREQAVDRSAQVRRLSRREHQVLALLGEGEDQTAIAQRLGISSETAKTHIRHVLTKLGVRSRVEAAALAFELGVEAGGL